MELEEPSLVIMLDDPLLGEHFLQALHGGGAESFTVKSPKVPEVVRDGRKEENDFGT